MPRTSYALKTFGSSTDGMLTATSVSNGAPADSAARPARGAVELRAAWACGWSRGLRGGEIADRGLLAGTQPGEAPETGAERRRCQTAVSQFACIFVRSRAFSSDRARFQEFAFRAVGLSNRA